MNPVLARIATQALNLAWCLGLSLGLLGCATPPPKAPLALHLLHDEVFQPPAPTPEVGDVFAMSPAMKAYAEQELRALSYMTDPRRALIDALYQKGRLQLDCDGTVTRNAAEAFEARAGNCLSLVIMTASFARHLGLSVSFQTVVSDDFYSRNGQLYLASGHVNLVLGPPSRAGLTQVGDQRLTVDFLPQDELFGQRTRPIDERTIVAMYLNNRAAEALVDGRLAQAYAYARATLLHDPGFHNAANTLGVIYNRAGQPVLAEAAFRQTLAGEPYHVGALSNLLQLLSRRGPSEEVTFLQARLDRLQPVPPFQSFNRGVAAMQAGHYDEAMELFKRELQLQPYQDEVHFWAARAYLELGQPERAAHHLKRAADYSLTRGLQQRYNAKLEQLRGTLRL